MYFFEKGSTLAYIRGGFFFFFFIIFLLSGYYRTLKLNHFVILFAIYIIFQLPFAPNIEYSLRVSAQVILPLLMFFVAYAMIKSIADLRKLIVSLIFAMGIYIMNFVLAQIFQAGQAGYSESSNFFAGNLGDNWNIFTYASILGLHLMGYLNSKYLRWLITVFVAIFVILVLVSFKRIAIIVLFLGALPLFLSRTNKWMYIKSLFWAVMIASLLSPIYWDVLIDQFITRQSQGRFESDFIESEARYQETFLVWEEILSFNNPAKSWLGLRPFDSAGNYANGTFGKRQTHIDYNLIVNTLGLIGLFFYLMIFVKNFMTNMELRKIQRSKENAKLLDLSLLLIILPLITSLSGQMYDISFRSMIFVFLGATFGLVTKRLNQLNSIRS